MSLWGSTRAKLRSKQPAFAGPINQRMAKRLPAPAALTVGPFSWPATPGSAEPFSGGGSACSLQMLAIEKVDHAAPTRTTRRGFKIYRK